MTVGGTAFTREGLHFSCRAFAMWLMLIHDESPVLYALNGEQ